MMTEARYELPAHTTILAVHNYYRLRGGEDAVFDAETDLLERNGIRVVRYALHNDHAKETNPLALAGQTLWSRTACRDIAHLIRHEQSHGHTVLLHAHNTLPLISPAIHRTASSLGVPTIQTLHNYRLFCANALFYRDGHICEDCLGKSLPFDGIRHACYRGSALASAGVVAMNALHHAIGTWQRHINRYVVFTEFGKAKCVESGLTAERIVVKPHAVEYDPGAEYHKSNIVLFVGRLSPEKGVMILLRAWDILCRQYIHQLPKDVELHIMGDGPERLPAEEYVRTHHLHNVRFCGLQPMSEAHSALQQARMLIYPSQLYETFGKSIIEAFACATPVICSGIGAMKELVQDGITGLHAVHTSPADFADQIMRLFSEAEYETICRNARKEFEMHYTEHHAIERLIQLYGNVLHG